MKTAVESLVLSHVEGPEKARRMATEYVAANERAIKVGALRCGWVVLSAVCCWRGGASHPATCTCTDMGLLAGRLRTVSCALAYECVVYGSLCACMVVGVCRGRRGR